MTTTLNGKRATSATVDIPKWGVWFADVTLDGEHSFTGSVELKASDLTLKGTVLTGGPDKSKSRSNFRIVGGAGGWGRIIPMASYVSGVTVATAVADAAKAAGESVVVTSNASISNDHWVREQGPAGLVLDLVSPQAWYVGEDGVTRLGKRPTVQVTGVTVLDNDATMGAVHIASESIAKLLPGAVVGGVEAIDVRHTVDASSGLRTTIWGYSGRTGAGSLDTFRELVRRSEPNRKYMGAWEYRVVTRDGDRVNLQPVRVSTGMPDLRRVRIRPGLAGAKSDLALGSTVVVMFVNADPSRPYVCAFEDPEGEGFKPPKTEIDADEIIIAGGLLGIARVGDTTTCPAGAGTITSGSTKAKCG